ncbi:MAG: bifunctional protein-serine/threonine kinase/phosphatase [Exilibacterium sp.]
MTEAKHSFFTYMTKLFLDAGFVTDKGLKSSGINEDYAGINIPTDAYLLLSKGAVLAIADGVSSAEAGKEASKTAVTRFIDEYFATPDTWSVSHSGKKVLSTINLRLHRKSHKYTHEGKGFLSTFSAVVIKGRFVHFFHVGDSRVYLLRKNRPTELECLTTDHKVAISNQHSVLSRAIGMDNHLTLDYGKHELQIGDRLVLCTDGVYDFIDAEQFIELLNIESSAAELSQSLIDAAIQNNSDDNVSAIVAIIKQLPEQNLDDYSAKLTRLPFPPVFEPGMVIDGYKIVRELFASSRSQLYLVCDQETDAQLVMKTPSKNFEDDINYIDRFIQEEWIGSRIHSPNVVEIVRQTRPRTALYYLMRYVDGIGLDKWMLNNNPVSPRRAIEIVKQIGAGLSVFHDNEALHQDLKPANVLITADERAVIVDFGSVYVAGLAELYRPLDHTCALGTASYSDPLYLLGRNPGIAGDVYALATITYEIFTGFLPYSDQIEECHTSSDYDRLRYVSASLHNPKIPIWFDRALEKGVSFDLQQRYRTITELLKDLTKPNPEFLTDDPVTERSANTELFWKLMSGFWFLTLLVVMYLFSQVN